MCKSKIKIIAKEIFERKYRITKSTDNCLMFTVARRKHNRLLHITRSSCNKNCIINYNHNLKDMFVICNKFLGRKVNQVHSDLPSVESFANFFVTKIKNIIDTLPCPASSFTKIAFNDSMIHSFDPPSI